jgi:hypothetical protein
MTPAPESKETKPKNSGPFTLLSYPRRSIGNTSFRSPAFSGQNVPSMPDSMMASCTRRPFPPAPEVVTPPAPNPGRPGAAVV